MTSADAPSGPTSVSNQYCSGKDDTTVGEPKAVRRNSKKNVINYIERNKKELDQANQKVKSTRKELEREQTVTLCKNAEPPIMEVQDQRIIRSKVNSGLSRSKSQNGRPRRLKTETKPKFRLDMSQNERLQEDLKRNITSEMKEGIKYYVESKYAELE